MTFNDNARIDTSGVSRSSGGRRGAMIGGGGGILVLVVAAVIAQFTGVDITGFLGGASGSGTSAVSEEFTECQTGADANANDDCRAAAAYDSINTYWAGQLDGYRDPQLRLFSGSVNTACGAADSSVGPFYCSGDETIFVDTTFFDTLRTDYGASGGPLAQMYIVAHEAGHHVSYLTGAMQAADRSGTGPASDSVRLELQADCYAGAWVGSASGVRDAAGTPFLKPITEDQIRDALNAAATVGDDRIQQQSTGRVNPDSWTHGSSEQRQRWFTTGMNGGPQACDTFSVSAGEL